ncbi:protein MANNAN SYNTHESIS-RELATED 1 [Aegilops tauschii subsp. strangulata]|uniref:O-fucosyltransferase family protein n=3 Tax=Aegilops tauschii subsp. strangulata TaxID=200361 RepID=A0A453L697_AEGTS|nr:protein MANNAN SYNTHESIS-RELATED 1 [Aegilops tauschii subsp. strangulata]
MVDPRQVLAGFLTLSMFVMLGNMIKHDHFTSVSELAVEATGVELNAMKIADNTEITKAGVELEATEEIKPCWTKPSPKDDQSNGFVTMSLTIGPEYHSSQIADAVVIARYLGATLVLPEIRGNELGKSRKFQDMYDVEKFKMNLDGVVKVVDKLPAEWTTKKPAVIRVPNRVTEDFILDTIQPAFQKNSYLRLAIIFSSVSLKPKGTNNKDLDSTACHAMFTGLKLNAEYSEVAEQMLGRLKELSQKSDGRVLAVDTRTDLLEKKTCKTSAGARRKGCYNPQEVLNFLKKVGFSANTTIYLTETWWHKGLNNLKKAFPNTYTKDDIMPAEKKGEFLNSGDSDLARALDLEICSQSDVFVPAIPGMFYGNVAGKRIASGLTQILVPAPVVGGSAQASDFVSTYITKKSHFAYSCYC